MKATKTQFLSALVLMLGLAYLANSSYILAKAYLANFLLEDAWTKTLETKKPQKAWSWADSHTIAELNFFKANIKQVVLEEAIGRNMAFAPARVMKSGFPGQGKTTVISAHNDTHFSHLQQLGIDDLVELTTVDGVFQYKVLNIEVVDSRKNQIPIRQTEELILTTCFPFNQIQTGTSLRYVVTASLVSTNV